MQPLSKQKKWVWRFAFGSQQKSSLLKQFTREHNLIYLQQVKQSKDLQQYRNQSCVIQTDVPTLLSWQPHIPQIQLIFIGHSFKPDQLKIKSQYQQIGKCKHHSSFTDYQKFRKLMSPNLVFFYGPNHQHCEGAAATIAYQATYTYLPHLPSSANQMISKLDLKDNYTLSSLFPNPSEISVLSSRFNLRIIHFKHNRNDFPNMEEYFDQQNQILKHFGQKQFFFSIDASQSPQKMMDQIGQILCPQLIIINANNPKQKQYAQKYSDDSNTVALSIFSIQSINKRKNLPLAMTLKQKILLLNSIIYKNLNLKQIVLIDFPYHVNQIRLFQQLNRKFSRYVELDSPQEWMYSKQYTSAMYFLETQRFLRPDTNYELQSQLKQKIKYWVVNGPQGGGKTTVSKYLAQRYGLKLIQVETYATQLKEKLLTPEDGEELPIHKIINHFHQLFSSSQNQQFILDSFPFDPQKWLDIIDPPHLISLQVDPNNLVRRQRKKNEGDVSAEISEQQLLKAQQTITQAQKLTQNFTQINQQTVSYIIDYNCTIMQAQKLLSSVYQPRVFLIQSMPTSLYYNIALRYDCAFYNLAINSFEEIKEMVQKQDNRNTIIYGYKQDEGNLVSQDFYWIQKNIGKIRYLSIWNTENKFYNDQFLHLQRPITQKPKKITQQGEEEPQQQPNQQEEGEPKKKPLDIYAYQWTKPICHKNLSQWYFKLKKSVQEFQNNQKVIYQDFEQKLKRMSKDGAINIYEVVLNQQTQ